MKHQNESISRLDGDIYETHSGQFIDMRSIISVGDIDNEADRLGVAYPVYCRLLEKPLIIWCYEYFFTSEHKEGNITYRKVNFEKMKEFAEERRLEFIEVWKHWKRKNGKIV